MAKDQTALLEELRNRHHDAQMKLQETQQAFQAAQAAHVKAQAELQRTQQAFTVAQQQYHGWSTAYGALMAEEAQRKLEAEEAQMNLPTVPLVVPIEPAVADHPAEKSKTEIIRDLLRANPHGMAPTEIWTHVQGQFKYRAYLYSVLKRLTDKEELIVRRGKYAIRVIPQQVREETATIQ